MMPMMTYRIRKKNPFAIGCVNNTDDW